MITISGITWDHIRGYQPLVAANKQFKIDHPEVEIIWEKRSLRDFGDFPVSELAKRYDLIVADHPFMPQAYEDRSLVDLKEYFSTEELLKVANASTGKSFLSYEHKGTIQGMPVDAAAIVAAVREDLVSDRFAIPETFDELINLCSKSLFNSKIGVALAPTDIVSLYLSFCAQIKGQKCFDIEYGMDLSAAKTAILNIKKIKSVAHPASMAYNPIQLLEIMSNSDEIIYSPYLFGYVNYSRSGFRPQVLSFKNAPLIDNAKASTLLGGTGLVISAGSKHKDIAAEYIRLVSSSKFQSGEYYWSGGQPFDRNAWIDPKINEDCNKFFENTLSTIDNAYLRPRVSNWNKYQEQAGNYLNQVIEENEAESKIAERLNSMYREFCCK